MIARRRISRIAFALVAFSSPAFAQSAASAQAEELFKQGRAALEAKDYPTACRLLGASERLERAVGTLISLGDCEEAQGKIASARQHFREAADLADALEDRLQRGPIARAKVTALDPRVPRLTVIAAAGAPSAIEVKQDDTPLASASFGTSLPLDPGRHTLVVSAAGFEDRSFTIDLVEGQSATIEVSPGARRPLPAPMSLPTTDPPRTTLRPYAYTLGGLAVVSGVVGTVFGLKASSTWSDAKDHCAPGACGPGSQARQEKDDATRAGNVSTVAFIVGGAALAGGITLFVLEPSSRSSARIRVTPAAGGMLLGGTF